MSPSLIIENPLKFTIYGIESTASMIPRIILSELLDVSNTRQLHQVEIVNFKRNSPELKGEKYLKLNPQGIVPTLVVESIQESFEPIVIYETLAICYFLGEIFGGKLEPNKQDFKNRALFHQYMSLICNSLQGDSYHYYYPQRYVRSEDIERLKKETEERLFEKFKYFDKELSDGREYLFGEFGIIDIYLFVVASWSRGMNLQACDLPFLGKYMERIFNRKLVNEVVKSERDSEPYY